MPHTSTVDPMKAPSESATQAQVGRGGRKQDRSISRRVTTSRLGLTELTFDEFQKSRAGQHKLDRVFPQGACEIDSP